MRTISMTTMPRLSPEYTWWRSLPGYSQPQQTRTKDQLYIKSLSYEPSLSCITMALMIWNPSPCLLGHAFYSHVTMSNGTCILLPCHHV